MSSLVVSLFVCCNTSARPELREGSTGRVRLLDARRAAEMTNMSRRHFDAVSDICCSETAICADDSFVIVTALTKITSRRDSSPCEPWLWPTSKEGLEAREVLRRFLAARVPDAQKQFFGMRFLARQTQVEIAAELGIPRSTLEGWEHRLAEKLRAFLLDTSP
jgi:RNA polymerase sigma factor (sigma-70 family)